MDNAYRPPLCRAFKGLMASAVAAATPSILLWPFAILVTPIIFGMALLHGLLIGLPAYLLLDRSCRISSWHAALAGLLIGAVPTAIVMQVIMGDPIRDPTICDKIDTFVDQALSLVLILGTLGTIAGWVFHLIVHPRPGE